MFSKQDIEKYFLAEKQLSLLFIIVGSVAIIAAILLFLLLKTGFYKGAALPLLLVGLVQLIAGASVYKKSDNDRIRNVYAYDMNPGQLKNEELPRMKLVLKKFAVIKWVEVALVVAGLTLIFYYRNNAEKAFWFGLGLTLAIQALITMFADFSAEKRAKIYAMGIAHFVGQQ